MKIFIFIAGLSCVFAAEFGGQALKAAHHAALKFPDGKKITVDVVSTPEERERGLMFRKKLSPDYGMLFVFPSQSGLRFWMKNTLVSLDIVFIGEDKKITRVHNWVSASTEQTSDEDIARVAGLAQFVLELPGGTAEKRHLKEGQALQFNTEIPKK